jgi:hypothetical protein
MVPGLLKRLTGGLAAAGIEDTVRTRFFADLMKLHTRALGMDGKGKADATAETGASHAPNAPIAPVAPHAAPAGTIAPAPTTAPASTMAKARANAMQSGAATPNKPTPPSRVVADDSDSLDFTAEITVKNPFGGGDVQVEELDFTEPAAALAPSDAASGPAAASAAPTGAGATKASAKDVELPRRLKEGVWVGIRAKNPEEPRETAKLEYVSPLKTRYLFVDRQGKTVLECTRTDLSRRFRLRDLVILNEVPETSLFDRIMQGVVGKLGNA